MDNVVYGLKEIQERYKCSRNVAYKIIRQVKMSCNGGKLPIAGKILYSELFAWENDIERKVVKRL